MTGDKTDIDRYLHACLVMEWERSCLPTLCMEFLNRSLTYLVILSLNFSGFLMCAREMPKNDTGHMKRVAQGSRADSSAFAFFSVLAGFRLLV